MNWKCVHRAYMHLISGFFLVYRNLLQHQDSWTHGSWQISMPFPYKRGIKRGYNYDKIPDSTVKRHRKIISNSYFNSMIIHHAEPSLLSLYDIYKINM
jgi:hypothetical protein